MIHPYEPPNKVGRANGDEPFNFVVFSEGEWQFIPIAYFWYSAKGGINVVL